MINLVQKIVSGVVNGMELARNVTTDSGERIVNSIVLTPAKKGNVVEHWAPAIIVTVVSGVTNARACVRPGARNVPIKENARYAIWDFTATNAKANVLQPAEDNVVVQQVLVKSVQLVTMGSSASMYVNVTTPNTAIGTEDIVRRVDRDCGTQTVIKCVCLKTAASAIDGLAFATSVSLVLGAQTAMSFRNVERLIPQKGAAVHARTDTGVIFVTKHALDPVLKTDVTRHTGTV